MQTTTRPSNGDVRFTAEQYVYLGDNSWLGEGRNELIDGKIVRMAAQYDPHAWAVSQLAKWAFATYADEAFWVRTQATLICGDDVPEPDLAVLRWNGGLTRMLRTAEGAVLIAEVADSTLTMDLREKASIYAKAAVPEYWVVDVNGRRLVAHRQIVGDSYESIQSYEVGQTITPSEVQDRPLTIASLFSPKA